MWRLSVRFGALFRRKRFTVWPALQIFPQYPCDAATKRYGWVFYCCAFRLLCVAHAAPARLLTALYRLSALELRCTGSRHASRSGLESNCEESTLRPLGADSQHTVECVRTELFGAFEQVWRELAAAY